MRALMAAKIHLDASDKFRLIMDNNPHPMWIYDHETLRFSEVNRAATTKYGYSREEFLKMKITEIRPRTEVKRLIAQHKKFRLNRKHIGEWQHRLKCGRLIDVEITAYPLFLEGRASILVEAHDITEKKRTQEKLRRLAVAEERNRIAREMHDTLAQAFTGILLQLEAAFDVLPKGQKRAKEHIINARNLARKSLIEARHSVWQLRANILLKGSLTIKIKNLISQSKRDGVPIHGSIKGKARSLSAEVEYNLLRIIQEGLTNAIRHSEASRIDLMLRYRPNGAELILQDNGKGFDLRTPHPGFGLISIKERAKRVGAKLRISSKPTKGSKLIVRIAI
jgi:PAS domain S-box-containing protein